MKMFFWSILCYSTALMGLSWDIDGGLGLGYRRDSQAFTSHLKSFPDALAYKENNKNLQGMGLDAFIRFWLPYTLISIEGDYSWYLDGSLKNTSVILDTDNPAALTIPTYFSYKNRGTAYDVYGLFGVLIPLLPSEAFYLIPEFGYGIDYQSLQRTDQSPEEFSIAGSGGATSFFSNDLSQHPTKRTWWGPFVGGELIWNLAHMATKQGLFQLEGGYFFHFSEFSQEMNPFLDFQTFAGGTLVNEILIDLETVHELRLRRFSGLF